MTSDPFDTTGDTSEYKKFAYIEKRKNYLDIRKAIQQSFGRVWASRPMPRERRREMGGVQMKSVIAGIAGLAVISATGGAIAGPTLEKIKSRGELRCGVGDPTPGWHSLDAKNRWVGFGVDYCRAIATAVLGDPEKVVISPVGWPRAYEALRSNEVDVVTTSHTLRVERDAALGVNFPAPYMYSGITAMVRKEAGVNGLADLAGATVCTNNGSSEEGLVADWFKVNGLEYNALSFDGLTATSEAYAAGRCDAFATESGQLTAFRKGYGNPDEHEILPELFALDAMGPMVVEGDEQWNNIVRAVVFATIAADQFSINTNTVDKVLDTSTHGEVMRLLGKEGEHGRSLELSPTWSYTVLKKIGSYSEIYDRNLGAGSPIGIEPGRNVIVSKGGLLHSPYF
ncbi:MAG: transporter substrate-binding domain-containing protein [Mesorhizobium sp.]|nr:MAG: transporter substrate-binding domain-containing protein [Mesorhizobium sp.]